LPLFSSGCGGISFHFLWLDSVLGLPEPLYGIIYVI